tara:strand:- start:779 stop:1171 length:393 start_codon:yes stop_codon:yes gene_type:complete
METIMTNIPQKYQNLLDNFPFLSLCTYGGQEYIGIVQNTDNQVCSVYVYDLVEPELRKSFLELGEEWWWESNRTISINLVIGKRFKPFRMALMTFNTKDFEIVHGPSVSMQTIMQKRIKRRQIQLVKKSN